MPAREYCGDSFSASTFSQLCPSAQFRIIFQVLYIPVTIVGSILIIATISLLKRQLSTPHDCVIFAIAVVDLLIGVVIGPLHLLEAFPEFSYLINSFEWECAVFYTFHYCTDFVAFDLLTVMCVDRFVMIWKPIWHRNHIKRRTIIKTIVGILAFRAVHMSMVPVILAIGNDSTDYSIERGCARWIFPTPLYEISSTIFFIEAFLSLGLCIAVVAISSRHHQHQKKNSISVSLKTFTQSDKILKLHAIFLSSLVFVFLIMWLPGAVLTFLRVFDLYFPTYLIDLTRLVRFTNSGMNAPLYALTRKVYRLSFKFMLSTPPWRWNTLRKTLKSNEGSWVTKPSALSSNCINERRRALAGENQARSNVFGLKRVESKRLFIRALNHVWHSEKKDPINDTSKVTFDLPNNDQPTTTVQPAETNNHRGRASSVADSDFSSDADPASLVELEASKSKTRKLSSVKQQRQLSLNTADVTRPCVGVVENRSSSVLLDWLHEHTPRKMTTGLMGKLQSTSQIDVSESVSDTL